jgi:hypothetical protein
MSSKSESNYQKVEMERFTSTCGKRHSSKFQPKERKFGG